MSCSCGNSNSLTSCTCSDNCPNKTSDITLFDGNFSSVVVPEGASLNDVLELLESYVMTSVSDLNLTFTIGSNCIGLAPGVYGYNQVLQAIIDYTCGLTIPVEYGGFYAKSATKEIPALPNTPENTDILINPHGTFFPEVVYDDYSAYSQGSGIWTCPSSGYYDLSFALRLTAIDIEALKAISGGKYTDTSSVKMQTPAYAFWPTQKGVFASGLVLNGSEIITSETFSNSVNCAVIEMSGAMNRVYLEQGDEIRFVYINTISDYKYPWPYDYAAFSIRRIK